MRNERVETGREIMSGNFPTVTRLNEGIPHLATINTLETTVKALARLL